MSDRASVTYRWFVQEGRSFDSPVYRLAIPSSPTEGRRDCVVLLKRFAPRGQWYVQWGGPTLFEFLPDSLNDEQAKAVAFVLGRSATRRRWAQAAVLEGEKE